MHTIMTNGGDSEQQSSESPAVHIGIDTLSATIYLPEEQNGYYRGTRFDWNGVWGALRWGRHRYVTEWFDRHDPLRHDGLCGPVDEFSEIGYDKARVGEEFMKIGVGTLRKCSNEAYDRFHLYPIVNPGERTIQVGKDRISLRHLLVSDHYGYDYTKVIRLDAKLPGVQIAYRLKNLGPEPIVGSVYNHNFLTIDRMTTGVNTHIGFPFTPQGEWRENYEQVALSHDGIVFNRDLRPDETVFMGNLHAKESGLSGFQFDLANRKSGGAVTVNGNGHFTHMVFWACRTVPCLEPYTTLKIYPGESHLWNLTYTFYEL